MRRVLLVLLIALSALAGGCVTSAPRSRSAGSGASVLPDIPVRQWGNNRCGSGALSTVLNHFGDPVTEQELDARLDKGRNGGVVSIDLVLEARTRGFDAVLTAGSESDVVNALREQKPLMLMLRVLDLPRRSRDLFHYIVIDGIDEQRGLVRMQWGRGEPRWAPLSAIERAWRATGHATIVINGQSANRPASDDLLRRAVAFQERGRSSDAVVVYKQILRDTPTPLVYTNLGNALRESNEAAAAEEAYRAALALDPENRDALNNLAWHLFEARRFEEAASFARRAAGIDGSDHDLILDTLAQIESALGNCDTALETMERALLLAPANRRADVETSRARLRASCASR